MKDRLGRFLRSEGLTSLKFAELMEVQPSSISHILSGRNKPSFDFIEKMLARFPGLNPDWLILGKGEMFRRPEAAESAVTNVNQFSERALPFEAEKIPSEEITNVIPGLKSAERAPEAFKDALSMVSDKGEKERITTVNPTGSVAEVAENQHNTKEIKGDFPHMSGVSFSLSDKTVERIVVFYTDRTFAEYRPE